MRPLARNRRLQIGIACAVWLGLAAWTTAWLYGYGVPVQELPAVLHRSLGASPYALPAIVALFVVRPFILLPVWVLAGAAGLLFGPYLGLLASIVGDNLSAALIFFSARLFGHGTMEASPHRLVRAIAGRLRSHPFLALFFLRMLYIPFDGLSFIAGMSAVRFRTFFLATLLSTIPGLVAYSALGGSLMHARALPFVGAGALALVLATMLFRRSRIAKRAFGEVEALVEEEA